MTIEQQESTQKELATPKRNTPVVNVLAMVVFLAAIASLFVWEMLATRADKEFSQKASQGFKSPY